MYQLLPSLHRNTFPKLLLAKELMDAVAYTSVSVAAGPSTAL